MGGGSQSYVTLGCQKSPPLEAKGPPPQFSRFPENQFFSVHPGLQNEHGILKWENLSFRKNLKTNIDINFL